MPHAKTPLEYNLYKYKIKQGEKYEKQNDS